MRVDLLLSENHLGHAVAEDNQIFFCKKQPTLNQAISLTKRVVGRTVVVAQSAERSLPMSQWSAV